MRNLDLVRLPHQSGIFPRRKRRWIPTKRWSAASAENLSRAPRRRSAQDTEQIKRAVRNWLALPGEQRSTQQDLARSLGVSKQRINLLVHTLPPADPWDDPGNGGLRRTAGCDQTDRIHEQGVIPAHIARREALLRFTVRPAETAQPPRPSQPGIPVSATYQGSAGLRRDQLVLDCPVVDQLP